MSKSDCEASFRMRRKEVTFCVPFVLQGNHTLTILEEGMCVTSGAHGETCTTGHYSFIGVMRKETRYHTWIQ